MSALLERPRLLPYVVPPLINTPYRLLHQHDIMYILHSPAREVLSPALLATILKILYCR